MNEWNDIAVLTPPGDVDIVSVPVLRRRLDNLIDRGVRPAPSKAPSVPAKGFWLPTLPKLSDETDHQPKTHNPLMQKK